MICEYASSKKAANFALKSIENVISDIADFVNSENDREKIVRGLNYLVEDAKRPHKVNHQFSYKEICGGLKFYKNFSIKKSVFVIDLLPIIDIYSKNFNLLSTKTSIHFESFFDGSFYKRTNDKNTIYIALYADEINFVNPIGNIDT